MKLYKATTSGTIFGQHREYVDWFQADTLADAQSKALAELVGNEIPLTFSTQLVEVDPVTLRPIT